MQFEYARKKIQTTVKEKLGVSTIPKEASKTALIEALSAYSEPYTHEQCNDIINQIVSTNMQLQTRTETQINVIEVEEETNLVPFKENIELVSQQATQANLELSETKKLEIAKKFDLSKDSYRNVLGIIIQQFEQVALEQKREDEQALADFKHAITNISTNVVVRQQQQLLTVLEDVAEETQKRNANMTSYYSDFLVLDKSNNRS